MTEATRGEGGYLVNKEGKRFLEEYIPSKMELGPRDILSRAIIQEIEKGRAFEGPYGEYVHLDIRHLGETLIDEKLPFVRELTTKFVGIDPVHEPIPVRPVVHYMMGGIDTDTMGRTSLPGLYAAGEAACVSMNGANRLGSNSLTECLVFGARVGRQAASDALEAAAPTSESLEPRAAEEQARLEATYFRKEGGGERIAPIRRELQAAMERGAGVFRTEESLKEAIETVRRLRERSLNVTLDDHDRLRIELPEEGGARQPGHVVHHHPAGATHAHPAGPPVGQAAIQLVLDVVQRVEDHHVVPEGDLVLVEVRLRRVLRPVPGDLHDHGRIRHVRLLPPPQYFRSAGGHRVMVTSR